MKIAVACDHGGLRLKNVLIDGQQRTTTFLLLLKAMHLRITEVLSSMADTEEAAGLKRSLQQSLDYIFEILYRADVRKQIEIEKDWNKAKGVKILENVSINELYKNELKNIIEARTFAESRNAVVLKLLIPALLCTFQLTVPSIIISLSSTSSVK